MTPDNLYNWYQWSGVSQVLFIAFVVPFVVVAWTFGAAIAHTVWRLLNTELWK